MTLFRPIRHAPRDFQALLAARLGSALGDSWLLASASERPWASATFSGARHYLRFASSQTEAASDAARLEDALPEMEFDLKGAIVAEARVTEWRTEPAGTILCAEILLVDDDG